MARGARLQLLRKSTRRALRRDSTARSRARACGAAAAARRWLPLGDMTVAPETDPNAVLAQRCAHAARRPGGSLRRCCADAPRAPSAPRARRHAELKKFALQKHPQLAMRKCAARARAAKPQSGVADSAAVVVRPPLAAAAGRGRRSSWGGACRRARPRRAPGARRGRSTAAALLAPSELQQRTERNRFPVARSSTEVQPAPEAEATPGAPLPARCVGPTLLRSNSRALTRQACSSRACGSLHLIATDAVMGKKLKQAMLAVRPVALRARACLLAAGRAHRGGLTFRVRVSGGRTRLRRCRRSSRRARAASRASR